MKLAPGDATTAVGGAPVAGGSVTCATSVGVAAGSCVGVAAGSAVGVDAGASVGVGFGVLVGSGVTSPGVALAFGVLLATGVALGISTGNDGEGLLPTT